MNHAAHAPGAAANGFTNRIPHFSLNGRADLLPLAVEMIGRFLAIRWSSDDEAIGFPRALAELAVAARKAPASESCLKSDSFGSLVHRRPSLS